MKEKEPEDRTGFFSRVKTGLSRTRSRLSDGVGRVFLGEKTIDEELFEELETMLITSDVGVEATDQIMKSLTQKVARKELSNTEALLTHLKEQLTLLLQAVERPLEIPDSENPFVILMVGVNGAGKTTTIGKLAKRLQRSGKSVLLAAGDTYRAAAVEQLKVWGERNNVPVVAQGNGADSASVIYDALAAAKARNIDVLIADTAGRLQSKANLMEELSKIRRVLAKFDATAPHEVMLVLDAGTGQNAISQATQFSETVEVSGLTLSKLDGTAKGGVIFAIAKQLELPIRFIGVGEQIDDLQPFVAREFVQALFD
ncbi:MAG TPA: signal recognition particle-docking protein FtsY [Gammaproteobacteria bacterium]|nr:signal recognition particle-docking protein FtsY [Gammaproteobacteria bacterium]HIL95404.1 signal recognition particle-docking protein FtsY [Pseudomonadales bacterium]